MIDLANYRHNVPIALFIWNRDPPSHKLAVLQDDKSCRQLGIDTFLVHTHIGIKGVGAMDNSDVYLKAMLAMLARQSFPPDKLLALVGKAKQLEAYNLCDGTRTQGEIAKSLGLDNGNFSKTVGRWAELGILIKVSEGKEIRPLHLYPLALPKAKGGIENG